MSQPQDDKDSIVTKEYLEEYLAQVIDLIEKRQKGQFDSLLTAINTSIDEKLDPIVGRVNQLTGIINQGGAGGQPEAQQRRSFGSILQELQPIIQVGQDMGYLKKPENPDALDSIALLIRKRYERKIAVQAERDIKRWLGTGDLVADDVASHMTGIVEAAGHEPL